MVARPCRCPFKTPGPSKFKTVYSIRSLRLNLTVWVWGSLSVLPQSKTTEANYGSSNRTPTAPFLKSQYQCGVGASAESERAEHVAYCAGFRDAGPGASCTISMGRHPKPCT